ASVGGIVGPCVEMPFLERGSWIHLAGFPNAGEPAGKVPTTAPTKPGKPLPATGAGLVLGGALALAAATRRRRDRR
ncbi:MAG: hypothetical protein ACI867_001188, partial [Glaciecola sp.]